MPDNVVEEARDSSFCLEACYSTQLLPPKKVYPSLWHHTEMKHFGRQHLTLRSHNRFFFLVAFQATLQSQTLSAVDKKTNKSAFPSTGTLLALGKQDLPPAEIQTGSHSSPPEPEFSCATLFFQMLLRFAPGLLVGIYPNIFALGKGGEKHAVPWHLLLASGWRWELCFGPRWWSDARGLFSGGACRKCRPLEWALKADSISERAMMFPD